MSPWTVDSYENPLLSQESTVTVGGTTDGVYTVQIDGPEGTFQVSFTAAGNTADQIAAGLEAAADLDPDLLNITVASSATNVLTLTFIHPGSVYTITAPSAPSALTVAAVTAAGGVTIGLGVAVVQGALDDQAGLLAGGSVDADVLGITIRSLDMNVNQGDPVVDDGYFGGATMAIMRGGELFANVEDAVAAGGGVFARIVVNAVGQVLGGLRSDADGGDAIALAACTFRTTTTAAGLARIKINRP
jgi:hypothetical protein